MSKKESWACGICNHKGNTGKVCGQCGKKRLTFGEISIVADQTLIGLTKEQRQKELEKRREKGKQAVKSGFIITKVRDTSKPIEDKMSEPELVGTETYIRKIYYQSQNSSATIEQKSKGKKWKVPIDDAYIATDEFGEPKELRKRNRDDYDPTSRKNPRYWYWDLKIEGQLDVSPEAVGVPVKTKIEIEKLRSTLKDSAEKIEQLKNENDELKKAETKLILKLEKHSKKLKHIEDAIAEAKKSLPFQRFQKLEKLLKQSIA